MIHQFCKEINLEKEQKYIVMRKNSHRNLSINNEPSKAIMLKSEDDYESIRMNIKMYYQKCFSFYEEFHQKSQNNYFHVKKL